MDYSANVQQIGILSQSFRKSQPILFDMATRLGSTATVVRHSFRRIPFLIASRGFVNSARQLQRIQSLSGSWQLQSMHIRGLATTPVKVPSLGDSITEGTIVSWSKNVGDFVKADDVLLVIETDKVSVDIRSPNSGVVKKHLVNAGDVVKIGQELAEIDPDGKPSADAANSSSPAAEANAAKPAKNVTENSNKAPDVDTKPAAPVTSSAPAKPISNTTNVPATPQAGSRSERRVPMTRMRATIAKRLKASQNTAAMLTTFNEIDMTSLMEMRSKYKEEFEKRHNVKLGFMSAFVKASTAALLKSPVVNAYIIDNDLVYHDYVDVSVAVATPTGLVVPVLRNTETMSFADVERSIAEYGKKARNGQIAIEDMAGGTFTISNGGVYGSLMGTPILNPPQSAILGMHGIFPRPVAINGQVVIRDMMYVALTYDHRVIDGATAVVFLKDIKNMIEDPARFVLGL